HPTVEDGLLERNLDPRRNTVRIDAAACDAVKALGNVESLDTQLRLAAFRDVETFAPETEAILGKLIAVTLDREVHLLIHQARLGKGDPSVTIRHVAEIIDRGQFN